MRGYCIGNQMEWDEVLPFVMFAAGESIQESLRYNPFELIYGHQSEDL